MGTIRRSLSYLRKYIWLAIGSFLAMLVVTILSLQIPLYIQRLIDDGIQAQSFDIIRSVSIALIVITAIVGLASFFNSYWAQKASQGIAYDLRNDLYEKLENLEFSFHDKHNIGQLLTRTTSDVEALRNFFASGLLEMIAAIITFLVSFGILLNTNVPLTLSVLVLIPLVGVIFFLLFKKLGPLFGSVQKNLGLLNNVLQENIEGIRIVKGFTAEPQELDRYVKQNNLLYDENIKVIRTFASGFPLVFLLSNIATLVIIWFGGNLVMKESLSIGQLVAFNGYLVFLLQPIFRLGMITQQFSRANASAVRVFEIMDIDPTVKSKPDAIPFPENAKGKITFDHVYFSYQDSSQSILEDVNLEISPGEVVAIVGATGCGKSSLVNLIPRFYDTTEGRVLIDGQDVRNFELESLRRHVGVVLQEIRIFKGTIRDNILFGDENATDEQLNWALQVAQVDVFLDKLPGGLDFDVGERGTYLSGGQRQRVAIARMIIGRPKILIFDDAMSALDTETERNLQTEIAPYLTGSKHTTIVISQRTSSLQKMDKIILMDNGRIVDFGSHDDLSSRSRMYQKIISMENSNNENGTA